MEAFAFLSASLGSGLAFAHIILKNFGEDHRKTALSWMVNIIMAYVVAYTGLSLSLDFGWLAGEVWQSITAGTLLSGASFIFVFIIQDRRATIEFNEEMEAKERQIEEKQQQLFEIIERLSESSTKKD